MASWNAAEWRRQFLLMGQKFGSFLRRIIGIYLQGDSVFYQTLPFSELSRLSESEEDMITFFLLLPITKVTEDAECREELQRRLKALPFYKESWNYLADCMIRNTDWEIKTRTHPKKFWKMYIIAKIYGIVFGEN